MVIAGWLPIYWFSRALIHLLVITVESTAFTTKKGVYYTVGTRVRFCHLALSLPLGHHTPALLLFADMDAAQLPLLHLVALPAWFRMSEAFLIILLCAGAGAETWLMR